MTPVAQAISAALLHFVWQGLAVAFLLWVALTAMRHSPAKLRYAVSMAALALMTSLPFITAVIIYRGPAMAVSRIPEWIKTPDAGAPQTLYASGLLSGWIGAIESWILPVWFAGVALFSVRLIWSSRHVSKLRHSAEPAVDSLVETVGRLARRMNIARPVGVFMSRCIDTPAVVGWIRPAILLPAASMLNLSAGQLEAVLAHELAHVRRCDYLVNLLQTVAETLFFYHPAVWWASSRIRIERELCCDDAAVELCGDPVGYARALSQLERLRITTPEFAMNSGGGPLLYRIQRLTGVARQERLSRLPAILAAGVALLCFGTNLDWAQAQPQRGGEARVSRDAIWVDTVKFGDFAVTVRALGAMVTPATAELSVPSQLSNLVRTGQSAIIEPEGGVTAAGKVTRVGTPGANSTVPVLIELQTSLPGFAGRTIDGIIQTRMLHNVTYMGRPAIPAAASETTIFKLEPDGNYASRVKIRLGAPSATNVQILDGLAPGDRVILSDVSKYEAYDRLRLE